MIKLPFWATHPADGILWVHARDIAGKGSAAEHRLAIHVRRQEVIGEVYYSPTRGYCARLRGHDVMAGFKEAYIARIALVEEAKRVAPADFHQAVEDTTEARQPTTGANGWVKLDEYSHYLACDGVAIATVYYCFDRAREGAEPWLIEPSTFLRAEATLESAKAACERERNWEHWKREKYSWSRHENSRQENQG